MINLIPLAGAGSRFVQAGYADPKPLIVVDGLPMIIQAARQVPQGNKHIFICRAEHLAHYPLGQTLQQYYPGCTIISVDYLTEGQAATCLLAESAIATDEALLISACDNGMTYHQPAWQQVVADRAVDAAIFTFRNNVTVQRNPQAYGWVAVGDTNQVQRVSVKVPISDNPVRDHAVVGAFWFRHGSDFVRSAQAMISRNVRVNNEFYVDECMNNAIQLDLRVHVFEVDKYICWGTPNDLAVYNYWKTYFTHHHPVV